MTEDELLAAVARRRLSDKRTDSASPSLKLFEPAPAAVVAQAQQTMGLQFPPLLSRLYMEVGNGGYGPGYGLLGLAGGYYDEGRYLPDQYLRLRSEGWLRDLLPLWDWGDGVWSCLDVRKGQARIVTEHEGGPTTTDFVLHTWLEAWVAGVDLMEELFEYEEITLMNPFTRMPIKSKREVGAKGKRLRRWW